MLQRLNKIIYLRRIEPNLPKYAYNIKHYFKFLADNHLIKCDFDHKSCSKGSKNDALKTCANNIYFSTPAPLPTKVVFLPKMGLLYQASFRFFRPIIKCDFDPKRCFKGFKNDP